MTYQTTYCQRSNAAVAGGVTRPLTHMVAIEDESTTVAEVQARIGQMAVVFESTTISIDHSKRVDVEVKIGTLI